jgi:site-specific DNA-adenine methylase
MKKPFKSYNGGKESDGTFQKIISIMPPHDIYIEAFLGNGAIYRHKKTAFISSIGIDLDTSVIREWAKLGPMAPILINTDAISWLEHFLTTAGIYEKLGVRVLVYLDPPYPRDSRKSKKDLYRHEMDAQDHTRLLNGVTGTTGINFVISSYPNEMYNEALKEWNTIEFQSQTRSGTATEKVWYNYPTPTILHDYRYIGGDYREREQLKGIVTRNVSKFKRLPDLQRNAIIHQLKTEKLI